MCINNLDEKEIKLYQEIKNILNKAHEKSYKAINFAMVEAYFNIGRQIVQIQNGNKNAEYGKKILKNLSEYLTKEFGKCFTVTNLSYMRQFYLVFKNYHTLCDELSWSHYRLLLKVEDNYKRDFYIKECIDCNWSVRQLERQINSFYYERLLSSQNKQLVKDEIKSLEEGKTPQDIIKDPFILEFLGLKPNIDFTELELEKNLVSNLQQFLLEFGKSFSFVSRQKRITA